MGDEISYNYPLTNSDHFFLEFLEQSSPAQCCQCTSRDNCFSTTTTSSQFCFGKFFILLFIAVPGLVDWYWWTCNKMSGISETKQVYRLFNKEFHGCDLIVASEELPVIS